MFYILFIIFGFIGSMALMLFAGPLSGRNRRKNIKTPVEMDRKLQSIARFDDSFIN